jgi:hypothetical protein
VLADSVICLLLLPVAVVGCCFICCCIWLFAVLLLIGWLFVAVVVSYLAVAVWLLL